ncbi:transporter [Streptomyces venezuelae]|uniref:Transporter n=1 Tax=Streptomyces venezuelae TaxID=54571 RepID=A0A5P2D3S5_STRVZ|nr:transporter [Streptomyces venezuelae]QES48837.1 transporter [Streptomyces venezuelae]
MSSMSAGVPAVALTPVFVRLKLSLLRNGLKGSAKRKAAFIGSLASVLVLAALTVPLLALLRGNAHAGTVVVLLSGILGLGWAVMPLLFSAGDETLDPSRLVMLPLRPRPLVRALLASSMVGIGPLFTLCLAIGSVIAVAHGAAGLAAGVLAVPLLLLGCVALARTMATANVRLLSSRKGRDLAVLSGLLIAIGVQFLNFGVQRLTEPGALTSLRPAAEVVGWLPPASALAMVDSAGAGAYGRATGQLAVTLLAVLGLLYVWERSLTRLMVTPDGSTVAASAPAKEGARGGGLWGLLPGGRAGAVMQRTLRYGFRDPKTKAGWISGLAIGAIVPVVNALQGTGSVYFACFGAGMLGALMYNQFGQDTSAFWMVAQTLSTARDAYAELRARAAALLLITLPYTVLITVVTAWLVGNWAALPDALGLSLGLLGAMVGTGALSSAYAPYSIPQDGAFKSVVPGQAGLAVSSIFGGMFASALLCGPLIGLVIGLRVSDHHGLLWTVLPAGIAWGALLGWAGLRLAAPKVADNLPEILQAVSKG